MKRFFPYLAVVIAMLCWSVSGIAIKQALLVLPPFTMIVMRFTLAVLLMLLIGLFFHKNKMLRLQVLNRKDIPLFFLAGVFQPFLYYLLETFSYDALGSPTIAEALLSTSPLLSPLFAAVLLRERVTRNNIVGILISTVGMLLLVLFGSESFSIGNTWGVLLAFGAVTTAVLYTVILRRIPQTYSDLSIVFWVQLISLLFFYPTWACTEGIESISTLVSNSQQAIDSTPIFTALASVAYLSIFASVTAFILFCYTVRQIGVTQTNAFNNVRPIFTALFMLFLFEEQLPWGKWIGIILIILGLFVSQKQEKSVKY
jgi:drug/metabolite transporter (DMT)-like permease